MRNLFLILCMALILPLGVVGCAVDDGAPGAPGVDGTDGTDGDDGSDGSDGSDGTDGTDGAGEVTLEPGDCAVDLSATNPYDLFVCCSAGGTAQSFEGEDGDAEEDAVLLFDIVCNADSEGDCGSSACGDGIADGDDNCPLAYNQDQADADGDGVGDACDGDTDGDGIDNEFDVCPTEPGDSVSWACDEDSDASAVCEVNSSYETCEGTPSCAENNDCADASGLLHQWVAISCDRHGCDDVDSDGDGVRDLDDECPALVEDDRDDEGGRDGCPDSDNDGLDDNDEACPADAEDFDGVLDGDGCPGDDEDGDGFLDGQDNCPENPDTSCQAPV